MGVSRGESWPMGGRQMVRFGWLEQSGASFYLLCRRKSGQFPSSKTVSAQEEPEVQRWVLCECDLQEKNLALAHWNRPEGGGLQSIDPNQGY